MPKPTFDLPDDASFSDAAALIEKLKDTLIFHALAESANGPMSGNHFRLSISALESAFHHMDLALVHRARGD